jgi:hypothetical protein
MRFRLMAGYILLLIRLSTAMVENRKVKYAKGSGSASRKNHRPGDARGVRDVAGDLVAGRLCGALHWEAAMTTAPRFTRSPLETYEQVLWRLLGVWDDCYEKTRADRPLPVEAQLVCDLFWVGEAEFRRDIRKMWVDTFATRTRFNTSHRRVEGGVL